MLPSDTYRKPVTSITAVLLPFVTFLLTLPCNMTSLTKSCFLTKRRSRFVEFDILLHPKNDLKMALGHYRKLRYSIALGSH
jgi:hypothetical protein